MFTVEQGATRAANYMWTEAKLFETLGGWVDQVAEPDVAVMLARHSHHHAWHAEMWRDRIPELVHLNPDRTPLPANHDWTRLVEALDTTDSDKPTLDRLVGVYRVVIPHLVAAYGFHLRHTNPVADANTIRTLRLVISDLTEDWQEGEESLQRLISSTDLVRIAAARQARLQELLLAAGGVVGPATFVAPQIAS